MGNEKFKIGQGHLKLAAEELIKFIISLKKFEWLRVATNYFVALLAFYDLYSGLPASSFLAATSLMSIRNENITIQYEVICKMNVYIAGFAGYGHLLCVIINTTDRYIYINWPLRYCELVTNRRALVVSIVCFIITNLVSTTAFYCQDAAKPCTTIQMARFDVIAYIVVPTFLLAFLQVIIFYGKIAWLTYKAKKSITNQMATSHQSGTQKRATKVISLVVGVFKATYFVFFGGFFINLRVNNVWIQTVSIWLWQVSNVFRLLIRF